MSISLTIGTTGLLSFFLLSLVKRPLSEEEIEEAVRLASLNEPAFGFFLVNLRTLTALRRKFRYEFSSTGWLCSLLIMSSPRSTLCLMRAKHSVMDFEWLAQR